MLTKAQIFARQDALLLPGVSKEEAKLVAERLVETAPEAYIIQGQEIVCRASLGIALMLQHGDELRHLVSVADQAMYNAKSISQGEGSQRSWRLSRGYDRVLDASNVGLLRDDGAARRQPTNNDALKTITYGFLNKIYISSTLDIWKLKMP